ncbi:MAG: DUF4389 domain-containing protein [Spirochaetota bacterium]
MIVSCTNCGSQYSVNDSKIMGKKFGFECPKCGTNVEIDNREEKKERELSEQTMDKKGKDKNVFEEKISFPDEDKLIADDGLLDSLSEEALTEAGIEDEGKDTGKTAGKEMPSDKDLSDALEKLSSDTDDDESFNIEDMELPDLENMGSLSEEGATSDEEISKVQPKPAAVKAIAANAKSAPKFDDSFLDEVAGDDILSEDENLLEDLAPMEAEEDILSEKTAVSKPSPLEELTDETIGAEFTEDLNLMDEVKSDEIFSHKEKAGLESEDEDITIDLDSLDIQLDEDEAGIAEGRETEELSDSFEIPEIDTKEIIDIEGDFIESSSKKKAVKPKERKTMTPEDEEDITLDLDALDLTLDEVEELKEGEALEGDDERISLSDAGLTTEELMKEDKIAAPAASDDEDIRLNIDEVAPEVTFNKEIKTGESDDIIVIDDDQLPEIDLDKYENEDISFDEDKRKIDFEEPSASNFREHEEEIASPDSDIRDTVPGGIINFSIDYSLKYSRIGAIFRLLCLYPIVLIPHFIVLFVYSVLSLLLSLFNWIIIAFSGTHEEDFTCIQENTIRYMLSLSACSIDAVEEIPKFAGRKDINYSLQYDATYPVRYSRLLAILRISVAGILLAALPHIIILAVLSIGTALICLIGIIAIIIRKRWPGVLFDFIVKYYRYMANVLSFITGVVDRYPRFKFE